MDNMLFLLPLAITLKGGLELSSIIQKSQIGV